MKKGFTLIELLAVIVILAIIAIIAIPIIMDIIEDSRKSAAKRSAEGYVRAVNYKIAQEALKSIEVADGDYVIGENALVVEGNNVDDILGGYTISDSRVLWAGLCVGGYSIEYNSTTSYTEINKAGNYCKIIEPYSYDFTEEKSYQSLDALCTGNSADSIYSNKTNYKIENIEDLVCLSNLVSSGKNFDGKTIYLINDLDFNSDDSYKDKDTTTYGDINGNSTTEGLKIELTTGAGFKPIGSVSTNNQFKGTFLGYAHTISNLKINRSIQYVGLFGYNVGTIKGITLKNVNITGTGYVGGLAGYSHGKIHSISVTGTVTGTSEYVGGVIGNAAYNSGAERNQNLLFSGNVTGNTRVGGIVGSGNWHLTGAVYNSTIRTTTDTNALIGKCVGSGAGDFKSSSVTLSYKTGVAGSGPVNGKNVETLKLYNVDDVLDTYIGGDNDSDGYYFDYDDEGNITLYSTSVTPIINTLEGEGTSDSPYLIANQNDWKIASSTVTQNKYYSITSDIDFNNNYLYTLGTNTNRFNGNINGNMHTLSNITLYGYDYAGVITGYNTGTIVGITISNSSVSAKDSYVGTITGYNDGTIRGITLNDITVTGIGYVGGLVGANKNVLTSAKVTGTVTGTSEYVGGVIGQVVYNSSAERNQSLLFSGNVTGSNRVGGITGSGNWHLTGAVYNSTVRTTATGVNTYIGKSVGSGAGDFKTSSVTLSYTYGIAGSGPVNGKNVETLKLYNVDDVLDTYIGGDNDSDGYYFDYDDEGNITLYSTSVTPIINTLEGEGTSDSPYLIANQNDWKIASSTVTQNKYYSITSDIDFNNNYLYTLGTNTNRFNGNINGNMHTLSNITLYGYDYAGVITGYNTGTIVGITISNSSVSAKDSYVGTITGYNDGTIRGITLNDITVTGIGYVGGLVGANKNVLTTAKITGTVTGTSEYVGGVIGNAPYNNGAERNQNLLFSGSVTGSNRVGGITGAGNWHLTGAVYNSTVRTTATGVNTYLGKCIGSGSGTFKVNNVTLAYTYGIAGSGPVNGTEVSPFNLQNVSSVLDTTDSDSDGYYFGDCNSNIVLLSKKLTPIGTDACTISN